MENSKAENKCLYFLKGCACLAVILLHATPPGKIAIILKGICTFAVPLFFMISGYYFSSGGISENSLSRARKKIMSTLSLSIVSTIFYFVWAIVKGLLISGVAIFTRITQMIQPTLILRFLIFNEMAWLGEGAHLWYLYALLYVYVIIWASYKMGVQDKLIRFSPLLIVVYLLLRIFIIKNNIAILGITPDNSSLFRNWFFTGLPWFAIGAIYRKQTNTIEKSNVKLLCVKMLIAMFAMVAQEYVAVRYVGFHLTFYLSTAWFVTVIFKLSICKPGWLGNKWIGDIGRRYSAGIYIVHLLVINIYWHVVQYFEFETAQISLWICPVLVFLVSLGVSVVWKNRRYVKNVQ